MPKDPSRNSDGFRVNVACLPAYVHVHIWLCIHIHTYTHLVNTEIIPSPNIKRPPPHNKNSKCVFIIRVRLLSLLDENVDDDDDDDEDDDDFDELHDDDDDDDDFDEL